MSFFRRVSTARLVALCAAVVAAIAGGTAIASAVTGGVTLPKSKRLSVALHDALTRPSVPGVFARFEFANRLVDSASLPGGNPLLTGAKGRLWFSPGLHRLRLELQSARGADSNLLVSDGSFSFYDGSSNTLYRGKLPQRSASGAAGAKTTERNAAADSGPPSAAAIQKKLDELAQHVNLVGPTPGAIAGHGAYTVRASPQHDGGLLGAAELAWEVGHGVPLRFAVYAQGNPKPVLELKATKVDFRSIALSDFNAKAPADAKPVDINMGASDGTAGAAARKHAGEGPNAKQRGRAVRAQALSPAQIQAALPFTLSAPATLDGLPRHELRLLHVGASPAVLAFYGQGLGGIAVIERPAKAGTDKAAARAVPQKGSGGDGSGDQRGQLPTISVNGTDSGHELATALGTLITFRHGAVDYIVVGSVNPHSAEAAARAVDPSPGR